MCHALLQLNFDLHRGLGATTGNIWGNRRSWHWQLVDALRQGCMARGDVLEARRLIVIDDEATNPFVPDAPAVTSVVGLVFATYLEPRHASSRVPIECRIDNAYVRPGFRRRGHLAAMVGMLAEWARSVEIEALDLQEIIAGILFEFERDIRVFAGRRFDILER